MGNVFEKSYERKEKKKSQVLFVRVLKQNFTPNFKNVSFGKIFQI